MELWHFCQLRACELVKKELSPSRQKQAGLADCLTGASAGVALLLRAYASDAAQQVIDL